MGRAAGGWCPRGRGDHGGSVIPIANLVPAVRVRPVVAAIFALALVVRLVLVPQPGNTSDQATMMRFGAQIATGGPHALYDAPDLQDFTQNFNYPPLFPYLLAATFRLWQGVTAIVHATGGGQGGALDAAVPPVPGFPAAAALIKLWAIGADLALGAVIYRTARRWLGPTGSA